MSPGLSVGPKMPLSFVSGWSHKAMTTDARLRMEFAN